MTAPHTGPSEEEVRVMLTTAVESWDARVRFVTTSPAREHATAMAAIYRAALALLDAGRKDRERFEKLQRAACVALGRHNEMVAERFWREAYGWDTPGTDWGEAQNALREAAGVTVSRNALGFLDFTAIDQARGA